MTPPPSTPERRPAAAGEAREVSSDQAVQAPDATSSPAETSPWWKKWRGKLAAAVAAVILSALGTWLGVWFTFFAGPPAPAPSPTPIGNRGHLPSTPAPGAQSAESSALGPRNTLPGTSTGQSLVDMKAVNADITNYQSGAQSVNSHLYKQTLSSSFVDTACGSGLPPFYSTYDLNNKYRYFRAMVGLSDDSPYGDKVRFSLLVNGRQKGMSPTVELGRTALIDVNVTGAVQITLQDVCTSSPSHAHVGDVTAVWINPFVIP